MTELLAVARQCGNCRLWRHLADDERGPVGPCRLLVRIGDVPASAPPCERYLARDAAVPSAPPPEPDQQPARTDRAPLVVGQVAPEPAVPALAGAAQQLAHVLDSSELDLAGVVEQLAHEVEVCLTVPGAIR